MIRLVNPEQAKDLKVEMICQCGNEALHGLLSLEECKTQVMHTTCCDNDGFCNFCGFGLEDEDKPEVKGAVACPACGSDSLVYVQPAEEVWSLASMPDEHGNCQLDSLLDTFHGDECYLECQDCYKQFDMDLTEKS